MYHIFIPPFHGEIIRTTPTKWQQIPISPGLFGGRRLGGCNSMGRCGANDLGATIPFNLQNHPARSIDYHGNFQGNRKPPNCHPLKKGVIRELSRDNGGHKTHFFFRPFFFPAGGCGIGGVLCNSLNINMLITGCPKKWGLAFNPHIDTGIMGILGLPTTYYSKRTGPYLLTSNTSHKFLAVQVSFRRFILV